MSFLYHLEAIQEAEVSKRRRDWAFNERDKIVQERESIRTLCDKLRRERDRAVSDLAEALRDSDDIKKQRNEASKEVKELREKIEAQLEKESRIKHLNSVGHNHSRDSAIDADLQEWESETLELEIVSCVYVFYTAFCCLCAFCLYVGTILHSLTFQIYPRMQLIWKNWVLNYLVVKTIFIFLTVQYL